MEVWFKNCILAYPQALHHMLQEVLCLQNLDHKLWMCQWEYENLKEIGGKMNSVDSFDWALVLNFKFSFHNSWLNDWKCSYNKSITKTKGSTFISRVFENIISLTRLNSPPKLETCVSSSSGIQ